MPAPNPDTVARLAELTPGAHYVPTIDAGEFPWVPFGEGWEIPILFHYDGTGPFDWTMTIGVVEGRPRCISFECRGVPVAPEALHAFPLGRKVEEAALLSARPVDEVPRRMVRWESLEEARRERAGVERQLRRRGASRGRPVTDALLAEVARIYRDNVSTGKPSKAVAKQLRYSDASARRLVSQARDRGLLGPARQGRVGEHERKEGESGA